MPPGKDGADKTAASVRQDDVYIGSSLSIHAAGLCCQRIDWLQVGLPTGGAIAGRQASPASNPHDPIGSPPSPTRRRPPCGRRPSPSLRTCSSRRDRRPQILISATNPRRSLIAQRRYATMNRQVPVNAASSSVRVLPLFFTLFSSTACNN